MNSQAQETLEVMASVMLIKRPKSPEEILKNQSFQYCVAYIANGGELVRATHLVCLVTGSSPSSALAYVRKVQKDPLPICEYPHGRDELIDP